MIPSSSSEKAVALAALIASGTIAYADAVRFENDGSFSFDTMELDITRAANEQVGFSEAADHAISLGYTFDSYSNTTSFYDNNRFTDVGSVDFWSGPGNSLFVDPIDAGDSIGTDLVDGRWLSISNFVKSYYKSYYYPEDFVRTPLDAGIPAYIGVRIDLGLGDGLRYGWVGVIRDADMLNAANDLDVFAWGYETEVAAAVGAGVPAPGVLGMFAFGAVGALSRSRSSRST